MNSPLDINCEICVIGRGLLGSATAKYLSEMGANVLLLGPEEPLVRSQHSGVFGSHYDSGRITRTLDPDSYCVNISKASINRYQEIEELSGIRFYENVGHLTVGNASNYLDRLTIAAEEKNIKFQTLNVTELKNLFPYLTFNNSASGIHESLTGGYLNPRALIKAQNKIFELSGCQILKETAIRIEQKENSCQILTENKIHIRSKKTILTTGAFINQLLPNNKILDIDVHGTTTLLGEVNENTSHQLRGMPSIIFKEGPDSKEGVYILPPIRYPDNKIYVKIGQSESQKILTSSSDLVKWFQSDGDQKVGNSLLEKLSSVFPKVNFLSTKTESCAVSKTSTGRQFIDRLEKTDFYILAAGNGYAAKSSDELGRMAAHKLMFGKLPREYYGIDLRAIFKNI